uniref:(northern house mosquito) hypothetical protein n=1 Tax=Culex pipiens TaxID=7175 RepID=A0A8D8J706_CULPI
MIFFQLEGIKKCKIDNLDTKRTRVLLCLKYFVCFFFDFNCAPVGLSTLTHFTRILADFWIGFRLRWLISGPAPHRFSFKQDIYIITARSLLWIYFSPMLSTRNEQIQQSPIGKLKFWNNLVPLGTETLRKFKKKRTKTIMILRLNKKKHIKEGELALLLQLGIRSSIGTLSFVSRKLLPPRRDVVTFILQSQKLIMILHRFACFLSLGRESGRGLKGHDHRG